MKIVVAVLTVLLLASALNVSLISPVAGSDSGLMGYWNFDEGSGSVAHDSSGHGFDGALIGFTANPWTTGRLGGGLAFDGYGFVDIGNHPELKPSMAITVEAWVKYDVFFLDNKGHAIISEGEYYQSTGFMVYQATGSPYNRVQFFICTENGKFIGFSSSTLSTGVWYHLAMTYDRSFLRLYINGYLDSTIAATGRIDWIPEYKLLIGSTYTESGAKFKGTIDEVRIWNQAMVPVRFTQSGLDTTAVGTVVSVADPVNLAYAHLPHVLMVKPGTEIGYDFKDVVGSSVQGRYFKLLSVNPAEPSTVVTSPMTITGIYSTQNYPVANAGGPYTAIEGSPITFNASASSDPNGDQLSFRWDFDGDGIWDTNYSSSATVEHTWFDDYSGQVRVGVSDGNVESLAYATVNVANAEPKPDGMDDVAMEEGKIFATCSSFADPGEDIWWGLVDYGDGGGSQPLALAGKNYNLSHMYVDDGEYILNVTVGDDDGGIGSASATIKVNNVAPQILSVECPLDPVRIGSAVYFKVTWTDPGVLDTQVVEWSWSDGSSTLIEINTGGNGSSTTQHTFTSPGVYLITVKVTDKDGGSDLAACENYVVVYDPTTGFVTGGGWIWSPAGAYTADPTLSGKATFGFVSKYQKGANVPTGNTEFQFHVAGLNFKSSSYQWLVIAGTKAIFKGTGTINGEGSYSFMISAIDGGTKAPDMFRIKIWDAATGELVYDNMLGASETADPTTAISGGSIVIHTK
ncbi:MAG: PKD domain-containing protein [Methanomassiliicoccales archaeon]